MTRTQIQQLVVALLLVLFVAVFLMSKRSSVSIGGIPPPPGILPAQTPEPPPVVVPPVSLDLTIPRDIFLLPTQLVQRLQTRTQEEIAAAEAARNKPVESAPVSAEQVGIDDLELQGIFWNPSGSQVIINRQIVSVGDQVEGAEVEEITKNGVILSRNGQRFELKPEIFRSSGDKKERSGQPWSSSANMR